MKIYLTYLILLLLPVTVIAENIVKVNMIRSVLGVKGIQYTIPFDLNSEFYQNKNVWRSPKGSECSISIFNNAQPTGTFTCKSPEGYKAQIEFDCTDNNSESDSAYLFFGLVGDADEIGNFYVWCS